MKLFYAIILGLLVLVSACAQQTAQTVQPTQTAEQPTAEPQQEETSEPIGQGEDAMENEAKAASGDVRIVGKEGFDPMQVTINSGDSVTWVNDDKKALTLTIFKEGKWYLNSDVIEPGQSFEQEFKEAGEYDYWTLAYGVKGKITVQ